MSSDLRCQIAYEVWCKGHWTANGGVEVAVAGASGAVARKETMDPRRGSSTTEPPLEIIAGMEIPVLDALTESQFKHEECSFVKRMIATGGLPALG